MVKFTHYLVTRFNVPVNNWNKDKVGQTTLDDAWMQHRLTLFTRYCVPTIRTQTEHRFHWIIYCDINTKTGDLEQIESAVSIVPGAMVRKVSHPEEMLADLKQLIANAPTQYVITSRVDNDDGLGINYVKIIHEHFKEKDKLLLNFTGGILYDPDKKVMTQMKSSQRNHYTSLVEEKNNAMGLLTVLGFPHDNPPPGITIENIPGNGNWLKIIHQRNVKSQLKGKPIFFLNKNYFGGIDINNFQISLPNTIIYSLKRVLHKFNFLKAP